MIYSLRRFIRFQSANFAATLAFSGAATIAGAGEIFHVMEHVAIPQQNVCQGSGCAVNTQTYAWHQTQWRRWPGTVKLLPSPGRGDRVEPVSAKPSFNMPTPAAQPTQSPAMSGSGARTPVSGPAARSKSSSPAASPAPPRSAAPRSNGIPMPDSATGVGAPAAEPSGPPVDLEKLFQDENAPPANDAPVDTEPGDIPPPFDSKESGASKKRDPNRTLSALSAGLKAKKAPASKAPRDPWQAAPVRNVNSEKTSIGGPLLKEPNLMPEPADGPELQATPSSSGEAFPAGINERTTSQLTADSEVSQVANWTESTAEPTGGATATGGNPLRSSSAGAGSRRSNPLRRN